MREAGGWTNDFLAGDGLREGNEIIACTPELRGKLCGLMAADQPAGNRDGETNE